VFVNICSDANVGKPASKAERMGGNSGLAWSIPYSTSQPRQDIDRSGEACSVYDLVFHPDTLYLAGRDHRMKGLVHNTALDALESAFQVNCDRNNLKFPRMKFKGVFRPTMIRKPLEGSTEPTEPLPSAAPTIAEVAPELAAAASIITPTYSIKYRSSSDLQDHVIQPQENVVSSRPKELVVQVELPLLDSANGVDLDVQEKTLSLVRDEAPCYRLNIDLPFPVDEEKGSAKFDKSKKVLGVSLPVKAAPQIKAERLSSSDSGIGDEPGYRIEESERDNEGYRTNQMQAVMKEEKEGVEEIVKEEEEKVLEGMEGFLEEGISYSLPGHTVSVQADVIILTLDVKNVKPGSFVKQVKPSNMAVAFKFSSIGAGYVEIHHAFAIDFLIAGALQEDALDVEFWDNNVIVSLPMLTGVEGYKAGLSLHNLEEKIVSLGQVKMAEVEPKSKKRKGGKYKQEKHPKVMPQEEQDAEQEFHNRRKERHGSGDSLDSCMSESPMESVILKLAKEEEDEASEKTEESCDEEVRLETPRYQRANSEDSTQAQPRGILKRKISGLVGTSRFRCYSESHLDEVGFATSSSPSLSTTTISEDQVAEFSGSGKKSVRFNEKVQQQMYRVNSTILANTLKNKRKAEKKKRALERRMSEGDACSLEQANDKVDKVEKGKMSTSSSLDLNMVINNKDQWESEEHEDSGLASSFEEHLVLTGDNAAPGKTKAKKMTKKRSKQFVMSNELIFDLDI